MPAILEREIKLRFASPEEARAAVIAAERLRCEDGAFRKTASRRSTRCCTDADRPFACASNRENLITFKGPVQPAEIKMRDELETVVGDGPLVLTILDLGWVWFRISAVKIRDRRRDCGR
jgi:adenylate cyclase class IV